MTDTTIRVLLVAAVGLVAVAAALVARRGSTVVRRRVQLQGLGPGLVLFTSQSCASCDEARRRLGGRPFEEIVFETAGPEFPPTVGRVPALAWLDEAGAGWIAYGSVSASRLTRWLEGP
jgi:hypothetical protein